MENVVNKDNIRLSPDFGGIYSGKKVLVTGHTGFKGSWLCLWLKQLGAHVYGYSLSAPSVPNHYELIKPDMVSITGDVRDKEKLIACLQEIRPEIVFHLAAQPLVRFSYSEPHLTHETNIMGTVNILEASRLSDSVRAVVNVTSDKCYENRNWLWGYKESDALGGYDPYSASKACSEIITSSYINSFFNPKDFGVRHNTLLASCRAGNVIGGGDWGEDRLFPDIVKSASRNESVILRSPQAIRPWQHVLDPLCGYLMLGPKLLNGETEFSGAWNFGPPIEDCLHVSEMVDLAKKCWGKISYKVFENTEGLHEAGLLRLDSSKAYLKLGWRRKWSIEETVLKTISWYRDYYEKGSISSLNDLKDYNES